MSAPRNLGLGFGENNQFTINLNTPNRAMINELPFNPDLMADIRHALQAKIAAAKNAKKFKIDVQPTSFVDDILVPILQKYGFADTNIHEHIIPTTLALCIPDILVDMNITRLAKQAIPQVLNNPRFKTLLTKGLEKFVHYDDQGTVSFFTSENQSQLTHAKPTEIKEEEHAEVSLRFLKSIIVSKYMKDYPELVPTSDIEIWKNTIFKNQLAYLYSEISGVMPVGVNLVALQPKIKLDDHRVYAYLIPAILDRMDAEDLKESATIIAKFLQINDFKSIASEDYFKPKMTTAKETVTMTNLNERSLQLFAQRNKGGSEHSTLELRGKVYQFQHTHIHFENDGEEKEYQIKDENGKILQFDGEVHNVFEYILPKVKDQQTPRKRLVAIGSPLKIVEDKENPAIRELLESVNHTQNHPDHVNHIKPGIFSMNLLDPQKEEEKIDFGKVFMDSINHQNVNDLIYHSWASLRSDTHAFQSGLRFILSKQPIEVSRGQYDALKTLFGNMRKGLQENEILDPVDRKAGWRKERLDLMNELKSELKLSFKHHF